ncbi:thiamine pyrophosphate-binding protein [Caballeronia sp. NK8]|nr:thiamine pyrophosphate-binding protein [Caballeronia sp. NK8]
MSSKTTVGDVIAAFLEQCGVQTAFGVISIHNMPMLDAIGRRGKIRFVGARGEAGAVNMADGLARVSGQLGVAFSSTGTGAGNPAGAMVEALTAGTPLLHLTGQIEAQYLDRNCGYIHEVPRQLEMLAAISKAAYRVRNAETALATVREAVRVAQTAPTGPVSVEIPIDIQGAEIDWPADLSAPQITTPAHNSAQVERLADALASAKRPLLWLGSGARHATRQVERLVALGFGVVTSVHGRGVLPEDHPMSLGAFNAHAAVEKFYQTCDAVVVVGSRLRGNETMKFKLALPKPLYRIDADVLAENRSYPSELFVHGDAALVLDELATRLEGRLSVDDRFAADLAAVHEAAVADMVKGLGPYKPLVQALQAVAGRDYNWVRDVTISNSSWGNRLLKIFTPRASAYAVNGGIGQGLQMAIGAAAANSAAKTICIVGDGGLMLNVGELATAVQENLDLLIVLMNDQRYGVIKNIQDKQYNGRNYYVELKQPDFGQLCASMGVKHHLLTSFDHVQQVLEEGIKESGPVVVEVDMLAIGDFATPFAGPATKKPEPVDPNPEKLRFYG